MRVAREYDAKGAYTSYVYDAFDRVTSKTAPSSLYQETYDYDDAYNPNSARVLKTIVSSAANAPRDKDRSIYKQGRANDANQFLGGRQRAYQPYIL
ncbi:MAG: hypothetical protein LBL96_01515 [Clostridiales bacterium]|nr:hypothetical protein [Clostridiales bacterium]